MIIFLHSKGTGTCMTGIRHFSIFLRFGLGSDVDRPRCESKVKGYNWVSTKEVELYGTIW